jgi:hypothetical protein
MNIRIVSSIVLSVAFVVLLITGVLLYLTPFNYFVSSLHIWGAILFLVCIALHFKNNFKTYKNHMQKRTGKWAMVVAVLGAAPIAIALTFDIAPVASVVYFGHNIKKAQAPAKHEYELIDLATDENSPKLKMFFKAGKEYHSAPQSLFLNLTYTSVPQIVVWMETLEGKYIDTLYITGKTSNSSYRSKDLAVDVVRRPEALPYWSHKRGIKANDGLYTPEGKSSDLDGIAAATPKVDYQVAMSAPQMGRYKLMVEVNRTYDFNEFYSKTRFPDDAIYSGSGSSGQPSLIYEAIMDSQKPGQYILNLIGHGHHSGKDGSLYTDLHNITSAKQILEFIVASVE